MSLEELQLYFEERIDPDFYFFNPIHGWTVKSNYFESYTFTLYQCIDKIWNYFDQESIIQVFEICVTAGNSILNLPK